MAWAVDEPPTPEETDRLLAALHESALDEVRLHLTPDEAVALANAAEDVAHSITAERPEAWGERADAWRLHATILDGLEARTQRLVQEMSVR